VGGAAADGAEAAAGAFARLAQIVAALRAPGGCPWDIEQTHDSIGRNVVEEAYEALEAIEDGDLEALKEELGNVLLQVVFQSQIAADNCEFTLGEVIEGINSKLVRRHPHVFGTEAALAAANLSPEQLALVQDATNPDAVIELWDKIKLAEKQAKGERAAAKGKTAASLLDGVPKAMPALMQAQDISRKAVAAGFEWDSLEDVWQQVRSEIEEFNSETPGSEAAAEEFGDILFALVNVARKSGIDAESALRLACAKFRQRWAMMEGYASAQGRTLDSYTTPEQEAFWQRAKTEIGK